MRVMDLDDILSALMIGSSLVCIAAIASRAGAL